MSSAIERLEKATDQLSGLVSSLLDRIAVVSRPPAPTAGTVEKGVELSFSAALPMQVNQQVMKINECVTRLQNALSRLEL